MLMQQEFYLLVVVANEVGDGPDEGQESLLIYA